MMRPRERTRLEADISDVADIDAMSAEVLPRLYGRPSGIGTSPRIGRAEEEISGTNARADATLTRDGDGAGSPVRKVAISWRSSEPSNGARATYSTSTRATPTPLNSSSSAALLETSISRLPWYGPRSLTRTISDLPLPRLVTRA